MESWVIGDFFRYLAEKHNVSSVVGSEFETSTVTAEFVDVPVGVAVDNVAKRVGASVRFDDGVFYIGKLDRSDRGVLVRRVRRLDSEELRDAVAALLTDTGSSVAYDDGLLIVSDNVTVLNRVSDMLDTVERVEFPTWVIQLQIIAMSQNAVDDLGLDIEPIGRLALIANESDVDGDIQLSIEAALSAVHERADVRMVAEPLLILGDGEKSNYDRVQRVPYATEITEFIDGNTRRTQNVEFLDIGFSINTTLREINEGEALIDLEVENSRVVEPGGVLPPVTSRDRVQCVVPVESGGVYLAGSFKASTIEKTNRLGLRKRWAETQTEELYQVWIRAYRTHRYIYDDNGMPPPRKKRQAQASSRADVLLEAE